MFQFPGFATCAYGFSTSSFGNLGINARLTAPPSLSQSSTPFIAFWRQDIPHTPLVAWPHCPLPSPPGRALEHFRFPKAGNTTCYFTQAPTLRLSWASNDPFLLRLVHTSHRNCCEPHAFSQRHAERCCFVQLLTQHQIVKDPMAHSSANELKKEIFSLAQTESTTGGSLHH